MPARAASRAVALGGLTAAGQLLTIGSLPWYSRYFEPSTYGQYLIFVGAAAVIGVFAGLRYDSAIVLPRNRTVAQALTGAVLLIAVVVAAVIAGLALVAPALLSGAETSVARSFGMALAAATVAGAIQRCLTSWCVREARFISIGVGQFALATATVVAQLLLAQYLRELPALVWGYVAALVAQCVCLGYPLRLSGWLWGASWRGMRVATSKYRRFPTYMVGYALASSVRDRLIQIMLGIGAGAATVGKFGLAYRVAFAPNSLIYSAVSPIFYAIASRGERLSVGRMAASLVEAMFVVLVVPYTAVALEAPTLTDAVLSAKWYGTGPYLQALAAPALMLAATCWLDRAFDSFRRQHVGFTLEAVFTASSLATVGVLSRLVSPLAVAWAFSALALAYYWIYFLTTFITCGFPMADFRRACGNGLWALMVALAVGALAHRVDSPGGRLVVYGLLMVAVVGGWLGWRGGAGILRSLTRLHVGDPIAGEPR